MANGRANGSTFLRDAALLVGIIIGILTFTFTIILPLYQRDSPISSQVQSNSSDLERAERELREARVTTRELGEYVVSKAIKKQKICAVDNGKACSALFDRLAANISVAQRKRLACDVLAALNPAAVAQLRAASGCPPPLRAPKK